MAKSAGLAIGIDLGTTFSCAAVFRNGKVEVIPCVGTRTTPSRVTFVDSRRFVGAAAKAAGFNNSKNTVFGVKRFIGRKYAEVESFVKHLPYKVIDRLGEPKIQVEHRGKKPFLLPQQISAIVLLHLVQGAEEYLGQKIENVVITVPAYFNSEQRAATEDAGKIAGVNVLALINEPTAASIAYALELSNKDDRTVFIFDFGGGTFDVSILSLNKNSGEFTVKATGGDCQLGGEDINERLADYCFENFNSTHGLNARSSPTARYILLEACENAKCILSAETSTDIEIKDFFSSKNLKLSILRSTFEDICLDLFKKTIEITDTVLKDAKLSLKDIDDVVMVGGSSKIPKIQELVKNFFSKELTMDINPDECVAYGAAVKAHIMGDNVCGEMQTIVLKDVTPLTLGVEIKGNILAGVIKRNKQIPCEESIMCTTSVNNQTSVKIQVYAGERPVTVENYLLDEFELTDIPKAPRKQPPIRITFSINDNGILKVSAADLTSGNTKSINIEQKGKLSAEAIDKMKAAENAFREEDKQRKMDAAARQFLEDFLYNVKTAATKVKLTEREKTAVNNICHSSLRFVESNYLLNKEECDFELEAVKRKLSDYMAKLNMK